MPRVSMEFVPVMHLSIGHDLRMQLQNKDLIFNYPVSEYIGLKLMKTSVLKECSVISTFWLIMKKY